MASTSEANAFERTASQIRAAADWTLPEHIFQDALKEARQKAESRKKADTKLIKALAGIQEKSCVSESGWLMLKL